jgi:hypothetical protein
MKQFPNDRRSDRPGTSDKSDKSDKSDRSDESDKSVENPLGVLSFAKNAICGGFFLYSVPQTVISF